MDITTVSDAYHRWSDLNDVFPRGNLEVWYMRPEAFRDFGTCNIKLPNPTDLEASHILLGSVRKDAGVPLAAAFEELWLKLQNWSPNGEACDLIRSKGLKHTSMSVGDCFRLNGDVYRVASQGFSKLALTETPI